MRGILVAGLLVIAAHSAAGQPAAFATPSQWDGQLQAEGEWIAIVLPPSFVASGQLEVDGPTALAQYQAIKPEASTEAVALRQAHPLSPEESTWDDPFEGKLAFAGSSWKSVFLRAAHLQVSTTGSGKFIVADGQTEPSIHLSPNSFPTGTFRPAAHQPETTSVGITSSEGKQAVAWSLQASGPMELEIHNGTLECSVACPRLAESSHFETGQNAVKLDILRYTNLQFDNGTLSLQGEAFALIMGGQRVDAALEGSLRLPTIDLAFSCGENACPEPNGQTLTVEGAIELNGLRPSQGDRLEGDVTLTEGIARLDERSIDAALLGPAIGVAAVGVGLTALVVKLLFGLFTRVRPPLATTNTNRRTILDAIRQRPGSSTSGLSRLTGLPRGTLRHHLAILGQLGLVESQGVGNSIRFYPTDSRDFLRPGLAALQDPLAQSLWQVIQGKAQVSQSELLASHQSRPRSTIQFRLGAMEAAGVIAKTRDGRKILYSATPMYRSYHFDAAYKPASAPA